MVNGFFLGGAAEGIADSRDAQLKRDSLLQERELKSRGLDIQERGLAQASQLENRRLDLTQRGLALQEQAQKFSQTRALAAEVDKNISDTMALIKETVTAAKAAGRSPEEISKSIQPLLQSAKNVAQKGGRDPSQIDVQAGAFLASPGMQEIAAATGTAEGTKKATAAIAETKALQAAGVNTSTIKDPKDRITAENSLRDDYIKNSADFIKIRDAKNRIDAVDDTGAGDVALVFQYMKILDPGSTVREGEFATASNAAGVPASVIAKYNRIVGGGILSPQARKEIKGQATKLYQAQATQHDRLTTQFANIAKRQGLNVDNVIVDLSAVEKKKQGGTGDIPPPPKGFGIVQ